MGTGTVVLRVALGLGLAFGIGFERELRGSPAGDRTFALIGAATAAPTAVLSVHAPPALAGVITGIGTGHLVVGSLTALGVLLVLAVRYLPGLRVLDARR